jgi:hypothetical protein
MWIRPFTGLPVILDNKERIIEFIHPDFWVYEEWASSLWPAQEDGHHGQEHR